MPLLPLPDTSNAVDSDESSKGQNATRPAACTAPRYDDELATRPLADIADADPSLLLPVTFTATKEPTSELCSV